MFRKSVALVAVLLVVLIASSASAVCGNRGFVNRNFNRGLSQEVIGNQLLTFDRNGNVVNRQFLNRGNRNFNRSLFFNDFNRGRLSNGVFLSF
jgi:hypothetical protein